MDCSVISSVVLPAIAIVISLTSAYVNSLHKSVDLATKYSSLCEKSKGNEDVADFDKILDHQANLAYRFYLWKSFTRLNDHKRSKFNYISFLVFTFGWLGMGLAGLIKESPEGYERYYVYLIGAGCMVFASTIIAYSRYQTSLYGKFISLRKDGMYQPAYAAVYQAKNLLLNESGLPIIASFLGSLIVGYYLEENIVLLIWNGVILALSVGNNVQIIRNGSKEANTKTQEKNAKQ